MYFTSSEIIYLLSMSLKYNMPLIHSPSVIAEFLVTSNEYGTGIE